MTQLKLNILFLTDGIAPFVTGGMQNFAVTMVKSFVKKSHNITLVHCGYTGRKDFEESYKNVFTPKELQFINLVFVPFLSMGKLPGHYIKENKEYSKKIIHLLGSKLSEFDFIYANGLVAFSFFNNADKVPVILNLHGFEMYQKAPNFKVKLAHYILRPAIKESVNKADFVLSFGGEIDTILNNLGVPKNKIIQQSNGLKNSWITTAIIKNQPITTITFIGRYERRKGIEELTEALKQLIKTGLEFKVNFIGPIPNDKQINHPYINYVGEVKNIEAIKNYLDESDFLICPSHAEGMPTVILEAMARGNAIIATNVGATSKLIKNNGWMIDSSIQSILSALKKAISLSEQEVLLLKKESIMHVKENFIFENFIDLHLKDIIQKLKL